jgi:predicted ester cyclase
MELSSFEKSERNKKLIMQFSLSLHEGVTEVELRRFTENESYLQALLSYRLGFPDYTIDIEDMTSEGDFVILHGIIRGTHKGDFHGIPATFRKVELPALIKYQIVDGKIVNAWPMFDQLAFMEQLGVIHKPG